MALNVDRNGDRPLETLAAATAGVIADRQARINTAIATVQNNPIGVSARLTDTSATGIVNQAAAIKPTVPPINPAGLASLFADGAAITGANEKLYPKAQNVYFSPFRVRVWSRKTGAVVKSATASGGIGDLGLIVGRYVLKFNVPNDRPPSLVAFVGRHPLTVIGKKVEIEKVLFEPHKGATDLGLDLARLTVQVNVIENILPLLALIAAAAAGLGLAGFGVADALESVDKVVVDTGSTVGKIVLVSVGGLIALKVFHLDRAVMKLFRGGR